MTIRAAGQVVVAKDPSDWVSEPQGITVDYARGFPLGQVVAVWVGDTGEFISEHISIGRDRTLKAPVDGSLWLQVNELSSSRSDNSGEYQLVLTAVDGAN